MFINRVFFYISLNIMIRIIENGDLLDNLPVDSTSEDRTVTSRDFHSLYVKRMIKVLASEDL